MTPATAVPMTSPDGASTAQPSSDATEAKALFRDPPEDLDEEAAKAHPQETVSVAGRIVAYLEARCEARAPAGEPAAADL